MASNPLLLREDMTGHYSLGSRNCKGLFTFQKHCYLAVSIGVHFVSTLFVREGDGSS